MHTFCRRLAASALGALACAAHAGDFNAIGPLSQTEVRAFSEDLASAIAYKGMIPAEPLGLTGFDLGVRAGATEVANREILRKAAGGASIPNAVPWAGVHAVKGLPFGIDIGVQQIRLPDNGVRATGGEIRWAFVEGSTALPALALRVSGMSLSGVPQLRLRSLGADLSISKGFLFLTPYAGVGTTAVKSRAPGTALRDESFEQGKVFAGVNLALGWVAVNLEVDKTGDATSYGLKAALRW